MEVTPGTVVYPLLPRQSNTAGGNSAGDEFLKLIADPFSSQVRTIANKRTCVRAHPRN